MAVAVYFLPLIIISINYVRLIRKLKSYVAPASNQSNIKRKAMQNNGILKMLIIITSMFLISSAVFYFILLFLAANIMTFDSLADKNVTLQVILALGLPATYISNILNPFIYIVYDKNIRRAVKVKLRRKNIHAHISSMNQVVTNMLSPISNC